jgi:hypothetical protein
VSLKADDGIWDATVFTKNGQRLLEGDIARAFFERVVAHARERGLLSDEQFTVEGTLNKAWASVGLDHVADILAWEATRFDLAPALLNAVARRPPAGVI